jgi:hypothetical protein
VHVSPPPEEIRVDTFLVADSAQVANGKLYILGGGWNYVNLSGSRSTVAAMTLAGRVVVPWSKTNRDLPFPIQLVHSDGEEFFTDQFQIRLLLSAKPMPDQPPSMETATPFTIDIYNLAFPRPGEYAFVIYHEDVELSRVRFQVNFTGSDSPQQQAERDFATANEP